MLGYKTYHMVRVHALSILLGNLRIIFPEQFLIILPQLSILRAIFFTPNDPMIVQREIIQNARTGDVAMWHEQIAGGCAAPAALRALFDASPYTATVDFPSTMCWEALATAYPEAKVVHTRRRSAEEWYDSAANSIMTLNQRFPLNLVSAYVPQLRRHAAVLWSTLLGEPVAPASPAWPSAHKPALLAAYAANEAAVEAFSTKAEGRVLLQDHKKGWADLCAFLGKPPPAASTTGAAAPFPHVNSRAEVDGVVRALAAAGVLAAAGALALLVFAGKRLLPGPKPAPEPKSR